MPVKVVSQKRVFDSPYHTLDVVEYEAKSLVHDGYTGQTQREVFASDPAAFVLLYEPKSDRVLMCEQFRIGAWMAGEKEPFLMECPGGFVDEGETPEQSARREAREEAGADVTDIEYIGAFYPSPGCVAEKFHLFIGRIDDMKEGIHGLEEEVEEIKTFFMPADELISMLDKQEIPHGVTALMVASFARHRDRLRKAWGG
ncbi:MAG: NUDIX domain-containing protein [Alphaproteobacteria bacterium]|nr:NUDIX domain-containing protein [Alphaproteobacteria bacterium]